VSGEQVLSSPTWAYIPIGANQIFCQTQHTRVKTSPLQTLLPYNHKTPQSANGHSRPALKINNLKKKL